MIIEKILKREGDKVLVEMQGTSSEPKPVGYLAGSSFYCRDKGETYTFDGAEWVLTSTKMGGGVSGPKMPKDCAFYITEYGDVNLVQEQSDDEYHVCKMTGVPIKAKNIGDGGKKFSETMMCLSGEDKVNGEYISGLENTVIGSSDTINMLSGKPTTIVEYDFNGCTEAYGCILAGLGLHNIKGLDKITTLHSMAFAFCKFAFDELVLPEVTEVVHDFPSNPSGHWFYETSVKTVRLPKLRHVPNRLFEQSWIETFDLSGAESIESINMFAGDYFTHNQSRTVILGGDKVCRLLDSDPSGSAASIRDELKIAVPDNLVEAYKNAAGWSYLASRIVPISSI